MLGVMLLAMLLVMIEKGELVMSLEMFFLHSLKTLPRDNKHQN